MRRFVVPLMVITLGIASAHASPPSPATDFSVTTGYTTAVAQFTPTSGATRYSIRRWETGYITDEGWFGYFYCDSGGCEGGVAVCTVISNLQSCHDWYWAVRLYNDDGGSDVSNIVHRSVNCETGEVDCFGK